MRRIVVIEKFFATHHQHIILGGIFTPTETAAVAVFFCNGGRHSDLPRNFVLVILACLMVIAYVPQFLLALRDLLYAKQNL